MSKDARTMLLTLTDFRHCTDVFVFEFGQVNDG